MQEMRIRRYISRFIETIAFCPGKIARSAGRLFVPDLQVCGRTVYLTGERYRVYGGSVANRSAFFSFHTIEGIGKAFEVFDGNEWLCAIHFFHQPWHSRPGKI